MSSNRPEPLDLAAYGREVRRALSDLPPSRLADLLEDLDEHLAEVAGEVDGPLETSLGPPAGYAAELRRSAGLPGPVDVDRTGRIDELRDTLVRVSRHDAVRAVLAFLPELRPAWWVLRGWLAVVALGALSGYRTAVLPFGVLLGPPLVAAAVVLSVRLGRRAQLRPYVDPRQRLLAAGSNALLALLAVIAFVGLQQRSDVGYAGPAPSPFPASGGTLARQDGSPITNIYPYAGSGQPLAGVLLYDQDGRALDNLSTTSRDGQSIVRVVPSGSPPPAANAYPQQQRLTTGDVDGGPQGLSGPAGSTTAPAPPAPTGTAMPVAPPAPVSPSGTPPPAPAPPSPSRPAR